MGNQDDSFVFKIYCCLVEEIKGFITNHFEGDMMSDIEIIKNEIEQQIASASDIKALDDVRVGALGKKGRVTELLKTLGSMPIEERIEFGKKINVVKAELEAKIASKKEELEAKLLDEKLKKEVVDVTLPCRPEVQGRIHPVSKVYEEIVAIFAQMGFEVAEGPDIEDQFHNFNALNMPPNHPARQMQDTFYVNNDVTKEFDLDNAYVVRTHTSGVQIRTMEKKQPPIRIIAPGRTYRSDYDATHTPMFHQVEGLVIDKNVTFGSNISIGNNSGIGINARIHGDCTIGDHVMMGPDVTILTRNHAFDRTDAVQGFGNELLPAKARFYGHNKDQVAKG